MDWDRWVPLALGALNVIVSLRVSLAVSKMETKIAEARREDEQALQRWVEQRFERKAETAIR